MTETVPKDSIILVGEGRPFDYVDSFRVATHAASECSIDFLTVAVFSSFPAWASVLMSLRNWLGAFVGLETGDDALPLRLPPPHLKFAPGERAVFFRVNHRTDEEIVMAESDRHLDFRVSVRRTFRADGAIELELTTVVWFNHVMGRLYFSLIRPFHRLIVSSLVRRSLKRLADAPAVPAAERNPTRKASRPSLRGILAAWLSLIGGVLVLLMGMGHVFGAAHIHQLTPFAALSPGAMDFIVLLFKCVGILLLLVGALSFYFARGLALGDRAAKVFFSCVGVLFLGRVMLELEHPVSVLEISPPVLVSISLNALCYWVAMGLTLTESPAAQRRQASIASGRFPEHAKPSAAGSGEIL